MQARQDGFHERLPPLSVMDIRMPDDVDGDTRYRAAIDPAQIFQRSNHLRLQVFDKIDGFDFFTRHAYFNIESTVASSAGSWLMLE